MDGAEVVDEGSELIEGGVGVSIAEEEFLDGEFGAIGTEMCFLIKRSRVEHFLLLGKKLGFDLLDSS